MQAANNSILVIDDDLIIRKLLSHHLKSRNYNIYIAENPEDGFKILQNENINLVLCDVMMDGMDGFTFCQKVRDDERYRLLPFIFVTAKSSLEDKTHAMDVGGDDIITKPFNVEELLLKVASLLRRAEIHQIYGVRKDIEKSFTHHNPKLVLVDDDPTMSKLFEYNLSKAGFDCKVANNAVDGFTLIKNFSPDIIISDIMMPKVDGFEFRKMLLEDPQLKTIPFIFLTAKGNESDILDGYDLGITDYVVKTSGPRVIVAKVNAILKSLDKEKDKIVSELNHATGLMRSKVIPETFPDFEGFEIKHWHVPFEGVPGGDFIDYFPLNEDNLVVVLGDVMGKRWGAWYFAFAYAGYVRSALRMVLQSAQIISPGEILQQVNQSVYKDAKVAEVFATLSIIILDKKNKILKYSGAGDLPIIFKCYTSGEVKKISADGLLLGFAEQGNYSTEEINLSNGDQIFIMTDGIIESRNKDGEQFGKSALQTVLGSLDPDIDSLQKLKREFENFNGGIFEDDISLITIKCNLN